MNFAFFWEVHLRYFYFLPWPLKTANIPLFIIVDDFQRRASVEWREIESRQKAVGTIRTPRRARISHVIPNVIITLYICELLQK